MPRIVFRVHIFNPGGPAALTWEMYLFLVGPKPPPLAYQRNDLKAARMSLTKSSGCSHAAKWVPLSCLL